MYDLDAMLASLDTNTVCAILLDCEIVPPEGTRLDDLLAMLLIVIPPDGLQPVLAQWLAPDVGNGNYLIKV